MTNGCITRVFGREHMQYVISRVRKAFREVYCFVLRPLLTKEFFYL